MPNFGSILSGNICVCNCSTVVHLVYNVLVLSAFDLFSSISLCAFCLSYLVCYSCCFWNLAFILELRFLKCFHHHNHLFECDSKRAFVPP